jgi:hypothetical protein
MLRTHLVMLLLLISTTSGSDFVFKFFAYFTSGAAGLNYILTNKERGKGGFCVSNTTNATIAPIYDLGLCKNQIF